jgi:hypothetical protein
VPEVASVVDRRAVRKEIAPKPEPAPVIIEKQIIKEIQYVQAPAPEAPTCNNHNVVPFVMNVGPPGITEAKVHEIVNASKGGEREAVDTLQILLEEKIENTDDYIEAYKMEMTETLKEMNKKIREEINVRECTQREKLLDKM